jgi:hypothetical protein
MKEIFAVKSKARGGGPGWLSLPSTRIQETAVGKQKMIPEKRLWRDKSLCWLES